MIPEMSHPTSVCPHPERWSAWNEMTSEVEVLSFLDLLPWMLKPEVTIETGCHMGYGTHSLFEGIARNKFGELYACDLGAQQCEQTRERLSSHQAYQKTQGYYNPPVHIHQCSGVELINMIDKPIDLAFLDSGMDLPRMEELRALYPKLSMQGVVVIHDTGIQFGLREFHLGPTLRELDMQYIYLDTPRGLTLCKKTPEIYP